MAPASAAERLFELETTVVPTSSAEAEGNRSVPARARAATGARWRRRQQSRAWPIRGDRSRRARIACRVRAHQERTDRAKAWLTIATVGACSSSRPGEVAPLDDRRANRREVAGRHDRHVRRPAAATARLGRSSRSNAILSVSPSSGSGIAAAADVTPGSDRQAFEELLDEGDPPSSEYRRAGQANLERKQLARLESQIAVQQSNEAGHEHARTAQQQEADGDLRHNEQPAAAVMNVGAGSCLPTQGSADIHAADVQRRWRRCTRPPSGAPAPRQTTRRERRVRRPRSAARDPPRTARPAGEASPPP